MGAHIVIMKIKDINSYSLRLCEILSLPKPCLLYLPQQTTIHGTWERDIFCQEELEIPLLC